MDECTGLAAEMADALPVSVWLIGNDGRVIYRNVAADGMAPGKTDLRSLAHCLPGVRVAAYVARVRAGGAGLEEPAVLLRSGTESRMVQLRIGHGPPSAPGSVLITLEEISARLRVERLRALAETTIALCHEINNPLAILSGEIELLRRDQGAPPERVATLQGAVGRIGEVLRRLKRAAEPLEADYLPSRGVSMLDLSQSGARTLATPERKSEPTAETGPSEGSEEAA